MVDPCPLLSASPLTTHPHCPALYTTHTMELTLNNAAEVLKYPTTELQQIIDHPQTSPEAKAALAEASSMVASSSTTNAEPKKPTSPVNHVGDGRLQIVNEDQVFTYVPPF